MNATERIEDLREAAIVFIFELRWKVTPHKLKLACEMLRDLDNDAGLDALCDRLFNGPSLPH